MYRRHIDRNTFQFSEAIIRIISQNRAHNFVWLPHPIVEVIHWKSQFKYRFYLFYSTSGGICDWCTLMIWLVMIFADLLQLKMPLQEIWFQEKWKSDNTEVIISFKSWLKITNYFYGCKKNYTCIRTFYLPTDITSCGSFVSKEKIHIWYFWTNLLHM